MRRAGSLRGAYAALNGAYWMLGCLGYSFSASFLLGRGYTNSQLGLIVAAGYVLGLALQPAAAALADRSPRAPIAVITVCGGMAAASAAALLFLPGKGPAVTAVYGLFLTLVILLQPLVNAFAYYIEGLGTAVPFGMCRAVGSLCYGLLAAALGGIVARTGENAVPAAGILSAAALLGLMGWFAGAGTPARTARPGDVGEHASAGGLLKNRPFRAALLGCVFLFFSHSFLSGYTLQIVRGVGGGSGDMGLLTGYIAVLELPTMFLFDRLLRRYTSGGLLRFAAAFFMVKNLLALLAGSMAGLYGAFLFQLVSYALFIPASVRYAGELAGPGDANRAQAYVTAMCTLGSVCASGFGGLLIDALGLKAALAAATASAALGAAIMIIARRKRMFSPPNDTFGGK